MSDAEENKKGMFIVSRDSIAEVRRLMARDTEACVFLVGRGILLPVDPLFTGRKVYALAEEAKFMGVANKGGKGFELVDADRMVNMLLEHKLYNFG